jgi:hypothetical protein
MLPYKGCIFPCEFTVVPVVASQANCQLKKQVFQLNSTSHFITWYDETRVHTHCINVRIFLWYPLRTRTKLSLAYLLH